MPNNLKLIFGVPWNFKSPLYLLKNNYNRHDAKQTQQTNTLPGSTCKSLKLLYQIYLNNGT